MLPLRDLEKTVRPIVAHARDDETGNRVALHFLEMFAEVHNRADRLRQEENPIREPAILTPRNPTGQRDRDHGLALVVGHRRAGESWTVGTQKNMGTEMPTTAAMAGAETIVVPAGTFSNCLKVVYTSTKTSGTIGTPNGSLRVADGNVQDTVWYAKDVGIVKESQMSLTTYATKQGRIFNREEQTKLLRSHTPAK